MLRRDRHKSAVPLDRDMQGERSPSETDRNQNIAVFGWNYIHCTYLLQCFIFYFVFKMRPFLTCVHVNVLHFLWSQGSGDAQSYALVWGPSWTLQPPIISLQGAIVDTQTDSGANGGMHMVGVWSSDCKCWIVHGSCCCAGEIIGK